MSGKQFRRRRLRGVRREAVSLTLRPSLIGKLDAYAEELDWTRSGVVELILERELIHVMDEALSMLGRRGVIHEEGEEASNAEGIREIR